MWLNSLLITGWATVLTLHDLPAIYEKLSSEKLAVIFSKRWGKGVFFHVHTLIFYSIFSADHVYFPKVTHGGRRASLFLNTVWILKREIAGIVIPRLAVVALTIAQPFLVSQALRFLSMPKDEYSDNIGYGLIGAFAFVFIGSAVRLELGYKTDRAKLMILY